MVKVGWYKITQVRTASAKLKIPTKAPSAPPNILYKMKADIGDHISKS